MKLPHHWSIFFLVPIVAVFGALLRWWSSTSDQSVRSTENLSTVTTAVTSSNRTVDEAEQIDHAERQALFRAARQQARSTRLTSNSAVMLAVANQPKQAQEVADAMSPDECRQVFGVLMLQPDTKERSRALESILLSLAMRSIDEAIFLRQSISDLNLRNELTDYMLSRCPDATENPEKIARWLSDEGQSFYRIDDLATQMAPIVTEWGSGDPIAAAEFLMGLSPNVDRMSEQERERTLDIYGDDLPPLARAMRAIFEHWSIVDSHAAMQWAAALPDTNSRRTAALSGAIRGLTNQFPDEAKAFVEQQIGVNNGAPEIAKSVASALTVRDRQAAMQWVAAIPEPIARGAAMTGMLNTWITPPPYLPEFGPDDAQQVLAWANTLPADAARGTAWASVAAKLAIDYPDVTRDWLRTLPVGSNRAEAMKAYDKGFAEWANRFADIDPASALEMLRTGIFDPEFSTMQVRSILSTLKEEDIALATKWATEHGITMPANIVTASHPRSSPPISSSRRGASC